MKQGVSINFYIGDAGVTRLTDSGAAAGVADETPPPPTLATSGAASASGYAVAPSGAPPPPMELNELQSQGASGGALGEGPAPQLTPDSTVMAKASFGPEIPPPGLPMEVVVGGEAPGPTLTPEGMESAGGMAPPPPELEPDAAPSAAKTPSTRAGSSRRAQAKKSG